jgi:hypothetical protein
VPGEDRCHGGLSILGVVHDTGAPHCPVIHVRRGGRL